MPRNASKPIPPLTEKDKERFWAKVDKMGPEECWLWRGVRGGKRYGTFFLRNTRDASGRTKKIYGGSNRVAYTIGCGQIPDGFMVCHRCDVPGCCNPGHLFVGTQADNMIDCARKLRTTIGDKNPSRIYPERRAKGSRHGHAKLSDSDVLQIRAILEAGTESQKALATRFSVSRSTVCCIFKRKIWSHLTALPQ